MKLYLVTLKGMTYASSGKRIGISYVVSSDAGSAYQQVKEFVDKNDYGFSGDRELHEVKLIAEEDYYGNLETKLFLNDK